MAVLTLTALTVGGLGTETLVAATRDVPPTAPLVLAAEDEPTPEPTPTPSPSPTPWPTPVGVRGVDVSHWNVDPDFEQLHDDGARFVFSKASQGTSFVDDTYRRNTDRARAAGLVPGAYHFFDYNKGGAAQARHYIDTLKATSGLSSLLPLVVDVETLGSLGEPDQALARARLHALLDELYAKTGRYPMIYTSRHMWQQVVGAPTSFATYPLWVACWKCDTVYLPRGWSRWEFWQWGQFKTSNGKKLDGNVWRSTTDALKALKQRNFRLDRGAEWATTQTAEADLRGYDGTHVRYASGDAPFGPWQPYRPRFDLQLADAQGRQDVRLQLRSFRKVKSPVLRDWIKLDSVPPAMWGPRVGLRQGRQVTKGGTRVPMLVDMGASDATSGLAATSLSAVCGSQQRGAKDSTRSRPTLATQLERSGCRLTGSATDVAGSRTTSTFAPLVRLIDLKPAAKPVKFGPGWKMLRGSEPLGGTLARTNTRGAKVNVRIDGAQFAVVVRRGPAGGRLKVLVDGKPMGTIDLYAKAGDTRRVAYVGNVPRGKHTITLRASGTKRTASTSTIVWLDALLVLERRK